MFDKDDRMTGNGTVVSDPGYRLGHSPLTESGQICPGVPGTFPLSKLKVLSPGNIRLEAVLAGGSPTLSAFLE